MKVVQINSSDFASGGGGAIATLRLTEGLRRERVDCRILSGIKTTNLDYTKEISRKFRLEAGLEKLTKPLGLNDIHCVSSRLIQQDRFFLDADVVNFHILHSGYFSYLYLPALTRHRPGVMTLHDMWSFTGHCAYSYDCNRWQDGCGRCPYPDTYPSIARDATHWEWQLKDWVYGRSNLTIVAPSRWLVEQAQKSLLNRFAIHHIPYGIDTDAYQPVALEPCRQALGIPQGKRVLLFGAASLTDYRKGGDLLLKALQALPDTLRSELILMTLGDGGHSIESQVGIPVLSLGYVASDRLKSIAYSAADLFLFPTRADNLPLVLQESMACGTPMVSFDVGGVSDLVRPGVTGYLAPPEDVKGFSQGIVELLEDHALRQQLSHNCRTIALDEYPLELQAQRYIALYEQLLAAKS
jgi:glycosyltransferase involved in cell wall biosynthesis